jgi:hypothetical protein
VLGTFEGRFIVVKVFRAKQSFGLPVGGSAARLLAELVSIALIEFKKPQRDDYTMDYNSIMQCVEMIADIREGKFKMENGRPIPLAGKEIPAFIYIVCDITKSLVRILKTLDAQPMPDGNGYFDFHKDSRSYYEVIDYDKLLNDSKKRNRIFFDKLNLLSQN